MEKKAAFRQLCEDVSHCHLCQHLIMPPHNANGERLENDDHGLNTDTPYVNLWNLWCYNLDADIMIIGQDYGTREENGDMWQAVSDDSPTNRALKDLLKSAFGINTADPDASVFFTNAANCYRCNKTTGDTHPGWLPICANKFLGRLIAIIQPKAIISLGNEAFTALSCLDDIPLVCRDAQNEVADTLAERMKYHYQLTVDGKNIAVFPVYHTGALGRRNRSLEQQKEDWARIAMYMK